MRVLVVDDEPRARAKLRRMLESFREVELVGEAANGVEALNQCLGLDPHVIFLDVQMPELDGFGMISRLPRPRPSVIMVTAFDEHALRAFDAEVLDYLVKPVEMERLERTVRRLQVPWAGQRSGGVQLGSSPSKWHATSPRAQGGRLLLSVKGKAEIIRHADIEWLESADNYVHVHAVQRSILMRRTLVDLLEELGGGFVRVHRRFAIPLSRILAVQNRGKGDAVIVLQGGREVACSRQYKPNLLDKLRLLAQEHRA